MEIYRDGINFDAVTGETQALPHLEASVYDGVLTAFDAKGRPRWSTKLYEEKTHYEMASAAVDAGDKLLAGWLDDGLYAVERETGRVAWHADGHFSSYARCGDRIIAVAQIDSATKAELVVLDAARGTTVAHVPLALDAVGLEPCGEFLLMKSYDKIALHDRTGTQRLVIDGRVSGVAAGSEGILVESEAGLARYRTPEERIWMNQAVASRFLERTDFQSLDGGDLLVVSYGGSTGAGNDAQVTIARVALDTGALRWIARCASNGAPDVADHKAYAEVRNDHVIVVSQASCGDYLEVLGLATGAQRARWTFAR
jgi:hypothetical protein